MARSRSNTSKTGNDTQRPKATAGNGRAAIRWANPYLTVDDKKWLSDNAANLLDFVGELFDNIGPDESLSSWFDNQAGRYVAALTCRDPQSVNDQTAISIRGATRLDSLYALSYLVMVRFSDTPWVGSNIEDGDPWG